MVEWMANTDTKSMAVQPKNPGLYGQSQRFPRTGYEFPKKWDSFLHLVVNSSTGVI